MAAIVETNASEKQKMEETANDAENGTRRASRQTHDPNVTFEEYYYFAQVSRAHPSETSDAPSTTSSTGISKYIPFRKGTVAVENEVVSDDKNHDSSPAMHPWHNVSDEEYVQASRALRTATWGAIFYLITTDILGPYSTA